MRTICLLYLLPFLHSAPQPDTQLHVYMPPESEQGNSVLVASFSTVSSKGENLEGLERLEGLEGPEGLKGLEGLEGLKRLELIMKMKMIMKQKHLVDQEPLVEGLIMLEGLESWKRESTSI